jgi:putative membrane protein (TIGR04086 family)
LSGRAQGTVSLISSLAEGWFVGAASYLVLLALASALFFVWTAPPDVVDRAGAGLVIVACAIGGGQAARRRGHGGLWIGLVGGALVAAVALLPVVAAERVGVGALAARLAGGAVAGGVGGALGVNMGSGGS